MSDNLGPNQTRVLDANNRSFESVVYQRKKPPLSCEWNLTNNLASVHPQDVARFAVPSGWAIVGNLKDNATEANCFAGDVVCSSSYAANTFKLIALDKNIETQTLVAWVNGWKIVVQGTKSVGDENNIIILPNPSSADYRVDFVFLEVWRYLLDTDDAIHKHGNFLYSGINYSNDLIDPAIGIETSRRIQTQYRIRVATTIDIENYPSGFDPNQVFVQGPLLDPISTCSHAYFSPVPGDLGLWRAGLGDSAAQEDLQTVDGYTYAIPMLAVTRRNTSSFRTDDRSNGAGKSLADYLNGQPSDRPDNLYNNWIVADDILDMRSRITTADNMKELCETSFQKLTSGNLRGKLEKTTLGGDHFAKTFVQVDAVSPSGTDLEGSTFIGNSDGVRRMFSNAWIDQPDTLVVKTVHDKTDGTASDPWAVDDQVEIEVNVPDYPVGSTVASIEEDYISSGTLTPITDYVVSGEGTETATITVPLGSSLIGTYVPFTVDYTIRYASGQNGFSMLPENMLEFRSEDATSQIIASQDADIRVRSSEPVIALDGTHFNMLSNDGANNTESYNFGHQMIYHALGNGTNIITFPRTLFNYDILGVASVRAGASYLNPTIIRTLSIYQVNLGTTVATDTDIELALYTGTKFFETNKQTRAITDTYEMRDLKPKEAATGSLTTFSVDSTNQAIVALGSNHSISGYGIAYVDGVQTTLLTHNNGLPTDTTKSRAVFDFSSGPASGASIEVPVLMKSAISSTEGYDFFYHAVPYQGLLDSTATGVVETVGPALTTTAGSGAITDTTYSEGTAVFTQDSATITGVGTRWLSGVQAGYTIYSDATPAKNYTISQVYANDTLMISVPADSASSGTYTITANGQPSFYRANIMDRLPTYDSTNDSNGRSENISTAVTDGYPVLETHIVSKVQDIVDSSAGSVLFGVGSADRGRSQIYIPDALLGEGNLGLRFERLDSTGYYQKTYQSYILNKDNGGHLYLMVVGSETDSSSHSRFFNENYSLDTVDIFEMPGRPLTVRRTD